MTELWQSELCMPYIVAVAYQVINTLQPHSGYAENGWPVSLLLYNVCLIAFASAVPIIVLMQGILRSSVTKHELQ